MDDAANERGAPAWLVEPPGPGQVHFHLAVGEGVELSPSAREALEALMTEIEGQDVVGFKSCTLVNCPDLADCGGYSCTLLKCRPLARCLVEMSCEIAKLL